jgi:hypothetical protein
MEMDPALSVLLSAVGGGTDVLSGVVMTVVLTVLVRRLMMTMTILVLVRMMTRLVLVRMMTRRPNDCWNLQSNDYKRPAYFAMRSGEEANILDDESATEECGIAD